MHEYCYFCVCFSIVCLLFVSAGSVSAILAFWGDDAAPFLQGVQLTNTAGSTLAPQIVKPFLSSTNTEVVMVAEAASDMNATSSYTTTMYTPPVLTANVSQTSQNQSMYMLQHEYAAIRVQFAFLIVAAVIFTTALAHFSLFCTNGCTVLLQTETTYTKQGRNSRLQLGIKRKCLLLALFCLMSYIFGSIEEIYGGLLFTFTVTHLKMAQKQGTDISTVFWVSCLSSRAVAVFLSTCMRPQRMMVVNVTLLLIGGVTLTLAVNTHDSVVWICTFLVGLGLGSILPTLINWANVILWMKGKETAVLFVGLYIGKMTTPVLIGYLFQHYSAMWFVYSGLAYTSAYLLLYVALVYVCECCFIQKDILKHSSPESRVLKGAGADDHY